MKGFLEGVEFFFWLIVFFKVWFFGLFGELVKNVVWEFYFRFVGWDLGNYILMSFLGDFFVFMVLEI